VVVVVFVFVFVFGTLPTQVPEIDHIAEQLYAAEIVGHLYNDNLNEARFCWKRTPDAVKQTATMQMVHRLLQCLWSKAYREFHPAIAAFQWADPFGGLVKALNEKIVSKIEAIIEQAYSIISVRDFASFLALSPEQAVTG